MIQAKSRDVVEVPESSFPPTEKSPTTTMPDWEEESEVEKGAVRTPAQKKMPKKNGKGTTPKAASSKDTRQPRKVLSRFRFPLVRKRPPCSLPAGQVLAEVDIPVMVLEQVLLEPLEGDVPTGDVKGFLVLPLIIPSGFSQNWYCEESNCIIYPGDIVYGKHSKDGWIRTVSIQAPNSFA